MSTSPRLPSASRLRAVRFLPSLLINLVVLFFASLLYYRLHSRFLSSDHCPQPHQHPLLQGWADTNISPASQGKLWHPFVFRSFQHPYRNQTTSNNQTSSRSPTCLTWFVITTIFEPTLLLHQLRDLPEHCLVVVGDNKTDHTAWRAFASSTPHNRTVYLSSSHQQTLPFRSIPHLPWNHFGRKNVGYLYAISHGAHYIWDTDDDNILRNPSYLISLINLANSTANLPIVAHVLEPNVTAHLWNPYPAFNPLNPLSARPVPDAWPRGLPLEFVRDNFVSNPALNRSIPADRVGVFQSLANRDPDVDAIFRLTRQLPIVFQREHTTIALPHGRVAPFNAQATLWTRRAFWGLLLPVTVHGRVSDIWRSYIVQRLMVDVGLHTAFTSSVVKQVRNVHSLIADLHAEVPLYTQADQLIRWLQLWKPKPQSAHSLPKRMEQLMIDLYEIGIFEERDVLLTQTWLDDLDAMGYGDEHEDKSVAATLKTNIAVSLPETVAAVTKNEPKVAVCVSGQVRTLALKPEDEDHPNSWRGMQAKLPPPNMTVAESIQRNLYPQLGKPDVFMVVSTQETEHEPKVGDESVCEPLRPRNGGHLSCTVVEEKNVTISRRNMWEDFFFVKNKWDPNYILVQGLLQQLKGMWECHAAIKNYTKVTGKEYDWLVRLRPDDYIIRFPSLEQLAVDAKVPTVWYGSFKDCCCGNEDRLGVGRAQWMREYFDRFMYLQQGDWSWEGAHVSNKLGWNAEYYLMKVMKLAGVRLSEHKDISMCTVKPKHRKSRSDP